MKTILRTTPQVSFFFVTAQTLIVYENPLFSGPLNLSLTRLTLFGLDGGDSNHVRPPNRSVLIRDVKFNDDISQSLQ
ncbi:hypothetical protein V1477_014689 [Vespula maculifrons]|uniref:Uncharacterized protein n=1 Tax=Vespula maculifrons TaxID=7453 RepID=A0ABD2BI54_VESMC